MCVCGNRLYYMVVILKSGEKVDTNFWSRNKKGSHDNFIDGITAIYRKLGLNIMKDHIDIQDWGISYAQTSISRK